MSSDIQTPITNISNTRRSVSSGVQTPRSNISNTRRSVSSDILTLRTNISNTRRSVSSDILTLRTNKSNRTNVLSDNQNPRSGIYVSRHWEVTYQTPNVVLHLVSKQQDLMQLLKRRQCFVRYPNTEQWYIEREKDLNLCLGCVCQRLALKTTRFTLFFL